MKHTFSNGLVLDITLSQAKAVLTTGHSNIRKEISWLAKHPNVKRRLNVYPPRQIREALAQVFDDHELVDDHENKLKLVLVACEEIYKLKAYKNKRLR
jgi:hypothetical protein